MVTRLFLLTTIHKCDTIFVDNIQKTRSTTWHTKQQKKEKRPFSGKGESRQKTPHGRNSAQKKEQNPLFCIIPHDTKIKPLCSAVRRAEINKIGFCTIFLAPSSPCYCLQIGSLSALSWCPILDTIHFSFQIFSEKVLTFFVFSRIITNARRGESLSLFLNNSPKPITKKVRYLFLLGIVTSKYRPCQYTDGIFFMLYFYK